MSDAPMPIVIMRKPDAALADAMRGIKHALRESQWRPGDNEILPVMAEPFATFAARLAGDVGRVLQFAERGARAIGFPLPGKSRLAGPAFFGQRGFAWNRARAEPDCAAHTLHFGLNEGARRLCDDTFWISELACHHCMTHFLQDDAQMTYDAACASGTYGAPGAARLFHLVHSHSVFRPFPARVAPPGSDKAVRAQLAGFACCLWLFMPRLGGIMDECALLALCCDITRHNAHQITAAIAGPESREAAFAHYLEIV